MSVEKSAGAIVFWKGLKGELKYLLLQRREGDWVLPKGLIEPDEKLEETALREVREETGLQKLRFVEGFKETEKYFMKVKFPYQLERGLKMGEPVLKFVTYFLVRSQNKKARVSFEHQNFAWLSFEEAAERFKKRQNSLNILEKAHKFLKTEFVKKVH